MSRDIDRVINYVRELEREGFFRPVMAQVLVNRIYPIPTPEEIDRAAADVSKESAK